MKKTTLSLLLPVLLGVTGLPSATQAQRATPDTPDTPATRTAPRQAEQPLDISFPGGTLQEFRSDLKARVESINVLYPEALKHSAIPALNLSGVTPTQLFEALNMLSESRASRWSNLGNVWVLQVHTPPRQPKAHYIGHLIGRLKVEDITTAIRSTWALDESMAGSEIKYHPETQLLIAIAGQNALNIVQDVLTELGRSAAQPATALGGGR